MESQLPATLAIPHLTVLTNKRFGNKRTRALSRISFSINSGKFYILFSVNDAGSDNAIIFENKNFKTLI